MLWLYPLVFAVASVVTWVEAVRSLREPGRRRYAALGLVPFLAFAGWVVVFFELDWDSGWLDQNLGLVVAQFALLGLVCASAWMSVAARRHRTGDRSR